MVRETPELVPEQPQLVWLSVRLSCRGTSAAALTAGENVLCLRLLGHNPLGAINIGLGTLEMTPELVRNARFGPRPAAIGLGVGQSDFERFLAAEGYPRPASPQGGAPGGSQGRASKNPRV